MPRSDKSRRWTAEEVALLGQVSDTELARSSGFCVATIRRREERGITVAGIQGRKVANWAPEKDVLLGTDTDGKVAKLLHITADRVAQRRRRLGIVAVKPPRKAAHLVPVDGGKVRSLREAKGVTRFALAGHNTALASHLGLIESGQIRRVQPETLAKLCALLGCKVEEINE